MSVAVRRSTSGQQPARAQPEQAQPVRRVRHQVRDAVAVAAFSAAASVGLAAAVAVLLAWLGRA